MTMRSLLLISVIVFAEAVHATGGEECIALLESTEDQINLGLRSGAKPEELRSLALGQLNTAVTFLDEQGVLHDRRASRGIEILTDSRSPLGRMAQVLDRHFGWRIVYDPVELIAVGGAAAADPFGKRLLIAAYNLTRPGFRNAIIEHEVEHIRESEIQPVIESLGEADLASPVPLAFAVRAYSRSQRIDETAAYRRSIYRRLKVLGRFLKKRDLPLTLQSIEHLKFETAVALMTTARTVRYLGRALDDPHSLVRHLEFLDFSRIEVSLVDPGVSRIAIKLTTDGTVDVAAVAVLMDELLHRYRHDAEIMVPVFREVLEVLARHRPRGLLGCD